MSDLLSGFIVSIQPKPKKGLEDNFPSGWGDSDSGFNPAEAEEGFRSGF